MYGSDSKEYKASMELHTLKGLKAKARAKLRRGLLHSIAASVGSKEGPMVTVKSRMSDETKSDVTYDVRQGTFKLHAKHRAMKSEDGGPTPELILDASAPVKGGRAKVVVGLKMHF